MTDIFALVKICQKEQHANDFRQGRLYANPLGYFQDLEKKGSQADSREGTLWEPLETATFTVAPTGSNGRNAFTFTKEDIAEPLAIQLSWTRRVNIFCMYAIHSGQLKDGVPDSSGFYRQKIRIPNSCQEDLGKHAVVVTEVGEFKARVAALARRQRLIGSLYQYKPGLVKYQNYRPLFNQVWNRRDLDVVFCKGEKFSDQSEYRLAFDTCTLVEKARSFDIGNISEITYLTRTSEVEGFWEVQFEPRKT